MDAGHSPTLCLVHWDRLFEDLEGQLAAEWEAERAALDAESERLRIAKLGVRTRLRSLLLKESLLTVRLADRTRRIVRLRAVGVDWIAAEAPESTSSALIIPLAAISSIETDHGALLASVDIPVDATDAVRERMTLGFVMRDLARRRVALRLALRDGEDLHGTVDRAGADHFDLAVHDAGEPRRAGAVRAFRMIPFDALVWARTDGAAL